MSVRQLYPQTSTSPAEYEYTNVASCEVCGSEHDLDEDTGRVIVSGLDYEFVLCDDCHYSCSACGESCIEWRKDPGESAGWHVVEGTVIRGGKVLCLRCEVEAILASPLIGGIQ